MTLHAMTNPTMHTQTELDDAQAQTLSALIDGELPDDVAKPAIKQLTGNDAMRAHFAHYIAIGDAMRGLREQPVNFTDRVMAALEKEPVLLAPVRKPVNRRPALWLAAATMTAISWGLWQSSPRNEINPPMATLQQPTPQLANQPALYLDDSQPYLAAHQDFAQAVISTSEMRFSKASLEVRP